MATLNEALSLTYSHPELGAFVLHRPTLLDRVTIGRLYTQLSGGSPLIDPVANVIVQVKAILQALSDQHPKEWQKAFDALLDPNPLLDFMTKYGEWQDSFLAPSSAETTQPNEGNVATVS